MSSDQPSRPNHPGQRDRRRSPRVSCAGHARIFGLPSDGLALPGKVRDLSLLGCAIQTAEPLADGTRAEVLLRVNAASLRVLAQVRAIHVPSVMGLEFLRVSPAGKDILSELIFELARQQAIAGVLRAARSGPDAETLRRARAALLDAGLPLMQSMTTADVQDTDPAPTGLPRDVVEGEIDLFI